MMDIGLDTDGSSIAIERTPDFFQMAQQLSEFVRSLPLDQPTNDRLVALMVDQVQQAEKGAFVHGYRMGMEFNNHEQHPNFSQRIIPQILTS